MQSGPFGLEYWTAEAERERGIDSAVELGCKYA